MKIKLRPDRAVHVQKIMIGRVPTLVLRPAERPAIPVSVLWIHGWGYVTGMKEMVYMSRAMDLVKKYGVTVYSPGYRLAWLKPYPAAVDDCYQVLDYMSRQETTSRVKPGSRVHNRRRRLGERRPWRQAWPNTRASPCLRAEQPAGA